MASSHRGKEEKKVAYEMEIFHQEKLPFPRPELAKKTDRQERMLPLD